jgi:hypothetical protein
MIGIGLAAILAFGLGMVLLAVRSGRRKAEG